jgi:hypothetical protein
LSGEFYFLFFFNFKKEKKNPFAPFDNSILSKQEPTVAIHIRRESLKIYTPNVKWGRKRNAPRLMYKIRDPIFFFSFFSLRQKK